VFVKLQKKCSATARNNQNVSVSTLTRSEKQVVATLAVVVKAKQSSKSAHHGNAKALCWQYVGSLSTADQIVDDTRLYCAPCLDSIQKSGQQQCHISSLTSFGPSTSSGNINQHLSLKHGIVTCRENTLQTISKYVTKYEQSSSGGLAESPHELNRDILIWFCRDLLSFDAVEKRGFVAFFQKNFPKWQVPTAATLSSTALNDVYQSCVQQVKEYVDDVPSMCVMFDGWTDRYRARSYVGIRVSIIKDWQYRIVTLSCQVLVGHTGQQLADHVSSVISSFFPQSKRMIRATCHDGAANMVKASKLMKVDHYQHCVAHSCHLLLTVDSLNDVTDVRNLLLKCRNIVSSLHFKSYLIENEMAATADRTAMDRLNERISAVFEVDELDETYPVVDNEDSGDNDDNQRRVHQHTTLKLSCPTRWNSTLVMLESINDLYNEVQNALKKIGHVELCLHADEIDMVKQLVTFLKEFQLLTELVSTSGPTLSFVSLAELKIRKVCKVNPTDDDWLKEIKTKIAANVGRRLVSNNAAKIQRILDPDTKSIVEKNTAATLLLDAIQKCCDRGVLSMQQPQGIVVFAFDFLYTSAFALTVGLLH